MMADSRHIPLRDDLSTSSGLGHGINAILAEILSTLERLAESGRSGQIDVRSLPLSADERERLKTFLGEGEVKIELALTGQTRCTETAIPAVWWVEHFNPSGRTDAEFIEVTRVPDIVLCDEDEIRSGITRLRRELYDE